MKRKVISSLLAVSMMIGLCACGADSGTSESGAGAENGSVEAASGGEYDQETYAYVS